MNTCLLIVDAQIDFINGSLKAVDGYKPIPKIVDWIDHADVVIASRDWHPENHCSFKAQGGPWPAHCVAGTSGACFPYQIQHRADLVVSKGTDVHVDEASAFSGRITFGGLSTKLIHILDDLDVQRVIVCGYITEVCVKATALDSLSWGLDTIVADDAIAYADSDADLTARKELADVGIQFATFKGYKP